MVYQILTNKWFFTFVVGWLVLLPLLDWHSIRKNIWGGIYVCILQLYQDTFAHISNIYSVTDFGIRLLNSSAFFTFGVVITMGILFVQTLPQNPKLQLAHISVFVMGFLFFEYTVSMAGLLKHTHWNYAASFWDNILILTSLAWIKKFIYKAKG